MNKPTLQEIIAKMAPAAQETVRLVAEQVRLDDKSKAAQIFNDRTRGMMLWEVAAIKDIALRLAKEQQQ